MSFNMYKLTILLGLAAIALASDEPVTLTSTSLFNQDYNRNQRYQNPNSPFNTYTGNKLYKPYNRPNYFDKDYQKANPVDYYNKDYSNKNYNDYNQKFVQDGKSAGILRSVNEVNPDGSYQYGFDTQNGIAVEQQGVVKAVSAQDSPVVVQGFYRYISPEGLPVEVKYTADEFGYHPQGSIISGQRQAVAYQSASTTPADEK